MKKYRKLGIILEPNTKLWWSKSHISVPCPVLVSNSRVRVYYATRCKKNLSRVSYADFDAYNPTKLLESFDDISLDVGDPGLFDESGVQPTKIVSFGDTLIMYYAGYQLLPNGYYNLFSGVASSIDTGNYFNRWSSIPFLDRTSNEPMIRVGAVVNKNKRLGGYDLFYIAGSQWFILPSGKKCPKYKMMMARSDPFHNKYDIFENPRCILEPDNLANEIGFSRPWMHDNELYFSVRKLENGDIPYTHIEKASIVRNKVRRSSPILERSNSGFDSKMVCFPAIFDSPNGKRYLYYNGNGYGEEGLALAVLK